MKSKKIFIGEFIGSCFLVMIIVGSGIMAQNLTDDVNKAVEASVDSAFTTNCFTSIEIYLTYNVFDIS